ncbi:MAG TPA: hypothetical protein ENH82_05235 [bacterium]|nr:hypothetical protein [bacterium]
MRTDMIFRLEYIVAVMALTFMLIIVFALFLIWRVSRTGQTWYAQTPKQIFELVKKGIMP